MTNVLIVEDERLVSQALGSYVNSATDRYKLVQIIKNADDAELVLLKEKIDLIVMDICTMHSNGLTVAKRLKQKYPDIKIIIVTSTVLIFSLDDAREAHIDSFWHKEASNEMFLEVMDRTMAGESIYIDEMPNVHIGNCPSSKLSFRELETLYWLLKLSKVSQVAEKMYITEDGVKKHIKEIKRKTGINNTGELLREVVKVKLILPDYIEEGIFKNV